MNNLGVWNLIAKCYGFFSEMEREIEIGSRREGERRQMRLREEVGMCISIYMTPDLFPSMGYLVGMRRFQQAGVGVS